jgi:hypothetical protein
MASIEDERTFSDMDLKSDPAGDDLLQIADSEDGGRVKKIKISALLAEDGTDANAIHVDVAGEIGGIAAKASPTVNDVGVLEDAAAAGVKKSFLLGAILKMVGWVTALTAKATPVDADLIAVEDSEAAGAMKKSTIQQIFAAIGLIDGLTAKAIPVAADTLAINDSEAAGAAKKSTLQQLFAALGLVDGLAAKATPVGADTLLLNDSEAGGAAKKATVSSLPIAQAQVVSLLLEPAADAAVEILGTTGAVTLSVTQAGNEVITTGAGVYPGQEVQLFGTAIAVGTRTLVVQGGTLTIDATNESPRVKRNQAGDAWVVIDIGGASIV